MAAAVAVTAIAATTLWRREDAYIAVAYSLFFFLFIAQSPAPIDLLSRSLSLAESLYRIPSLMDAVDIYSRPQEQALMTYISLYREYVVKREEEKREIERMREETVQLRPKEVEHVDTTSIEEENPAAVIAAPSQPHTSTADATAGTAEKEEDEDAAAAATAAAVPLPLSPASVLPSSPAASVTSPLSQSSRPRTERFSSVILTPTVLAEMAARSRTDAQPELIGAAIDVNSLDAALSPASKQRMKKEREKQTGEDAAAANAPSSSAATDTATAADAALSAADGTATNDGPIPDNAAEDYNAVDADKEGPRANESAQQSIDRRIEQLQQLIEICIVTAQEQRYLQSDTNGIVRASEVNSPAAVWTVLEGKGDYKFLRDYQSRYLTADADGRVRTDKKNPNARWRIIKGTVQYFQSSLVTHTETCARALWHTLPPAPAHTHACMCTLTHVSSHAHAW